MMVVIFILDYLYMYLCKTSINLLMITSDSKYEWKNFTHDISIMISKERERERFISLYYFMCQKQNDQYLSC